MNPTPNITPLITAPEIQFNSSRLINRITITKALVREKVTQLTDLQFQYDTLNAQ